jgi:hypothetical protein
MTAKTQFTEQEWQALQKGITGAGFMMALADRGFFDSFKEAGALARHVREAREADSELIRELAEAGSTGFGITDSPEAIEAETMDALQEAVRALEEKMPEELEAYKSFVLEVAESVGNAAGGGEPAESATYAKISSALERS